MFLCIQNSLQAIGGKYCYLSYHLGYRLSGCGRYRSLSINCAQLNNVDGLLIYFISDISPTVNYWPTPPISSIICLPTSTMVSVFIKVTLPCRNYICSSVMRSYIYAPINAFQNITSTIYLVPYMDQIGLFWYFEQF